MSRRTAIPDQAVAASSQGNDRPCRRGHPGRQLSEPAQPAGQIRQAPRGTRIRPRLGWPRQGGYGLISLIELAPQGSSLEDAFFDLTKDETEYHAGQLAASTQGI